jgi:hypothetical protein
MTTPYDPPHLTSYRFRQRAAFLLLILIVLGAVGQLLLAVLLKGFLFLLTSITLLAFAPFVVMLLSATPPLTLSAEGITIRPLMWKARLVLWSDVLAFKPYPLLPRPDQEAERRLIQGKQKYRAAEGMMLVVRGLPLQYRMAGYFAGEGGKPIIAFTNRTHANYTQLVKHIEQHLPVEVRTQ